MITLYTSSTPNGWKISVALEELKLEYNVKPISLSNGEQRQDWFLKLNPNGRIPVIVDHDAKDFVVFESGAILTYLAEKSGKLMPSDAEGRSLVLQWLMFQMGGIGPMMGQSNVFYRYFPEKIQPAIDRYHNECRRLFEVIDRGLENKEWLADTYSVADIANWCWTRTYKWSGVSMEGLPNMLDWHERMKSRPACRKGIMIPEDVAVSKKGDSETATDDFVKNARQMIQR